jgi:6-phosphogluconolactonase
MKLKTWARLFLVLAPVLAGCKGFWDVPSGSGSGGGNGTASGIFYVMNQKTSEIAGFSFAAGDTNLTAVTKSPYVLNAAPLSAARSPNGAFLYVGTAAGVFVYGIDATTGELTILNSGNAISSDQASAMVVDPSGGWLIEAVPTLAGNDAVFAIPLDQTTGINLSGGSAQPAPNLPAGATVQQIVTTRAAAANPYVFVAMATSGIAAIPFTAASTGNPFGNGKVYSPINTTGGDTALALDTSAQILYAGETVALSGGDNPGGVRMFTIGPSATPLTEVTGSPFASGGNGPSAILTTATYVYVANRSVKGIGTGNIKAFAISSTAGAPTSLTDVASGTIIAGVATVGLTEDSTGTYILAVNNSGGPDLNAYTIDSTTGALASYAKVATGTDPVQTVAIVAHK